MHSAPVLISTIYAQHSADVRGLRAEQLTLAAAWLNDSKIEKVNKSSIKSRASSENFYFASYKFFSKL